MKTKQVHIFYIIKPQTKICSYIVKIILISSQKRYKTELNDFFLIFTF